MGNTLSNWVYIAVSFEITIISIVSISSAAGVVSIVVFMQYLKHKKKSWRRTMRASNCRRYE
ncbi:MAG: hypothetical protein ACFFB0_22370 [Promethearchaeota archaeon]